MGACLSASPSPSPDGGSLPVSSTQNTSGTGEDGVQRIRKAPPHSILANKNKEKEPRPLAKDKIYGVDGGGGGTGGTSPERRPGLTVDPDANPVELARKISTPKFHSAENPKRRSRRSSDGRKVVGEAHATASFDTLAPGTGGVSSSTAATGSSAITSSPGNNASRKLGPDGVTRKHSTRERNNSISATGGLGPDHRRSAIGLSEGRRHHHGAGASARRHHVKRRTSNNGMISRLALQFPLIRTSFVAVYRAFEQFMIVAARAEAEAKRLSARPGFALPPEVALALTKSVTESNLQSAVAPSTTTNDLQLAEAEGGAVVDAGGCTEDELRKAEIRSMLAANPAPLLEAPVPTSITSPPPVVSAMRVKELGTLTPSRLAEALQAITGSEEMMPPQEINELFNISDLDHSRSISFREFLIVVAFGYFLKQDMAHAAVEKERQKALLIAAGGSSTSPNPDSTHGSPKPMTHSPSARDATVAESMTLNMEPRKLDLSIDAANTSNNGAGGSAPNFANPVTTSPLLSASKPPSERIPSYLRTPSLASIHGAPSDSTFQQIQKGFRVVYLAFKEMDTDGNDSVDLEEFKRALFAASNLKNDTAILEQRFKELDFDSSGEITLSEFLFGVTAWVGLMDEDEELP